MAMEMSALLQAWRADRLSDAEAKVLLTLLEDPRQRETAHELLAEQAALETCLSADRQQARLTHLQARLASRCVETGPALLPSISPAAVRPKRRRPARKIWASLAGAVLVAVVCLLLFGQSREVVARSIEPLTHVERDGKELVLPAGSPLYAGDLVMAREGDLIIAQARGRHCLSDGVLALHDAQHFFLRSGELEVRLLPADVTSLPFVVSTRHVRVQVTGTFFRVIAGQQDSQVTVLSGSVQVADHVGTEQSLQSDQAVKGSDQGLGVVGPADSISKSQDIFVVDAADPTTLHDLEDGAVEVVDGHMAIRAVPDPDRDGLLAIDFVTETSLWPVNGDELVEISYKAALQPNWMGMYIRKQGKRDDANCTVTWTDEDHGVWTTRRFPLSRIYPSNGDRLASALQAGDAVRMLRFQASATVGALYLRSLRIIRK